MEFIQSPAVGNCGSEWCVLTYSGGNMALYLIYNDDTAYEQLQDLRNSSSMK